MPTTIVFSSEKGGVGKTTSAVNLATAFSIGGYKVLLVDMDPQGSIRFSFGIKNLPSQGTMELLSDPSIPLSDLVVSSPEHGMDYIFSNINNISQERKLQQTSSDPETLGKRLKAEAQGYDIIILDAPASTNILALNAITAGDLVLLPLQCESLAIKSLKRFLVSFKELQKNHNPDLRIAGILLTMYDRNLEVHRRISRQVYETLFDSAFSTIIPRSREITEASALGQSVITYSINSIGATAYIRLAKELLDKFELRPSQAVS